MFCQKWLRHLRDLCIFLFVCLLVLFCFKGGLKNVMQHWIIAGYCETMVVCATINQVWSNHTDTVPMRQINWVLSINTKIIWNHVFGCFNITRRELLYFWPFPVVSLAVSVVFFLIQSQNESFLDRSQQFLTPCDLVLSRNEAPIPTHFFVILTSCGNSTFSPVHCEGPLHAKSFILPHRPDHTESCAVSNTTGSSLTHLCTSACLCGNLLTDPTVEKMTEAQNLKSTHILSISTQNGSDLSWVEDWLQFHVARVRDVELLTGLSFYHDRLSVEETLQLKTLLQTA